MNYNIYEFNFGPKHIKQADLSFENYLLILNSDVSIPKEVSFEPYANEIEKMEKKLKKESLSTYDYYKKLEEYISDITCYYEDRVIKHHRSVRQFYKNFPTVISNSLDFRFAKNMDSEELKKYDIDLANYRLAFLYEESNGDLCLSIIECNMKSGLLRKGSLGSIVKKDLYEFLKDSYSKESYTHIVKVIKNYFRGDHNFNNDRVKIKK